MEASPFSCDNEPPGGIPDPNVLSIISETTPQYDINGKMIGVEKEGEAASVVTAKVGYHGSGQIEMQQEPDGTITRYEYDDLGRLIRTYRGTNDAHVHWGTAPPLDPNDPNHPYPNGYPDNLALVEKRAYGEGTRDANRHVLTRTYRDAATNPYFDPNGPPNNENEIGWTALMSYDWRMRPVVEEQRDASEAPLRYSLTWLDHNDRPVLVAEFEDIASVTAAELDPRDLPPGAEVPSPSAVLACGPLTLSHTIYNARGLPEEQRRYDVTDVSGTTYTATLTYYDHAGRAVEVRAPNAPIVQYVYDAKGRQIVSRQLAKTGGGLVVVSQAESAYDTNDRVTQTVRRERADASGAEPQLSSSNSIAVYNHTWYDKAGRITHSASYGTNSAGDVYTSGSPPAYNPQQPPVTTADGPLVTTYEYDEAGRQSAVIHPDGRRSAYEYDGLGRITAEVENAGGSDPNLVRRTEHRFDDKGRLECMALIIPTGGEHKTCFEYGATVVDSSGAAISQNNTWISKVYYPREDDPNVVSAQPSLTMTYYIDGSVATRTDAKGLTLRYTYDELGRLVQTEVDNYNSYDWSPPYVIERITVEYDALDRPVEVVAFYNDGLGDHVVAQNQFAYDGFGNLITEWQQIGGSITPDPNMPAIAPPRVDYAWEISPATQFNYNRVSSVTYPEQYAAGGARRALVYNYGDNTSDVDNGLSRLTQIDDVLSSASASFDYMGLARRVGMAYGNGVQQGAGLSGLDRFGRVKDLRYSAAGTTLHRYQYGYDLAGNRSHVRVQHWQADNTRSYLYGYDALQRLTEADFGALDSSNTAMTSTQRATEWTLDLLGNWVGDGALWGMQAAGDLDGDGQTGDLLKRLHVVNGVNELTQHAVDSLIDGVPTSTSADYVYDHAGNLLLDDAFYYQYDPFNRLVCVYEKGDLTASDLNLQTGMPQTVPPGDWVVRYIYDGLGRLVVRQQAVVPGSLQIRQEEYVYDGVRRIQEFVGARQEESIIVDPNDPSPLEPPYDRYSLVPLLPNDVVIAPTARWNEREYIWGPEYVDELLWQVDKDDRLFYSLLDASYTLNAIVSGSATTPATMVREQYAWSPYGELLAKDCFYDAGQPMLQASSFDPFNRVGHQGLFFEPLAGAITTPPLSVDRRGLWFNRNRFYDAALGRFLQSDQNATALPVLTALAYNAQTALSMLDGFDAQSHFGDGFNLYSYGRANPVSGADPLGLSWDYFAEVDAWTDDRIGNALYTLGTLNEKAASLSMVLWAASSLLPGSGLLDVVHVSRNGVGGFWGALELAMNNLPGGRAVGIIGKAFKWRWTAKAVNGGVKLTGQLHHAISKQVWRALDRHKHLKGHYSPRDPRFVTQAVDGPAHKGYQAWHRQLDEEVAQAVSNNPDWTPQEFESYLRARYNEADFGG